MKPDAFEHQGRLKVAADLWALAGRRIAGALAEAGVAQIEHFDAKRPCESSTLVARQTDLPAILSSDGGRLTWAGGQLSWAGGWFEWSVADPALHRAFQAINASGSR